MKASSIQLAKDFIENHYSEKLLLPEIAKNSFLSPFHFHRIFQAEIGLTPREYQEKIRLERGAHLIHVSDLPIGDIAFEVGYENPETFIRRFKANFGISPEKFRKKKNISKLLEIKTENQKRLKIVQMNTKFMGRIELQNDVSLISVRHTGPFQKLNKSWKAFVQLIQKQKILTKEDQFYGIVRSNPDVSQEDEMIFDLCYETKMTDLNDITGVHSQKIHQGSYAVFSYKGEFQYFDVLYPYMYKTLLNSEDVRLRDGILFEKYIQSPIFYSERNCITEIYIPID